MAKKVYFTPLSECADFVKQLTRCSQDVRWELLLNADYLTVNTVVLVYCAGENYARNHRRKPIKNPETVLRSWVDYIGVSNSEETKRDDAEYLIRKIDFCECVGRALKLYGYM